MLSGGAIKNVIIPIIPFIFGGLLRYAHYGQFKIDFFHPADLCFSITIVCFEVIAFLNVNCKKKKPDDLAKIYNATIIILILIFATVVVYQVQNEVNFSKICDYSKQDKTSKNKINSNIEEINSKKKDQSDSKNIYLNNLLANAKDMLIVYQRIIKGAQYITGFIVLILMINTLSIFYQYKTRKL